MNADVFLGLSKKRAQDVAEAKNMIFRLIRIDNEHFLPYPEAQEALTDRICVEIDNGKVTKATVQ